MAWGGWSRPSISSGNGSGGLTGEEGYVILLTDEQSAVFTELPELTGNSSDDSWVYADNLSFTDTPTLTLI